MVITPENAPSVSIIFGHLTCSNLVFGEEEDGYEKNN